MDRTKIKQGRTHPYKTHNSEGTFKVAEVYKATNSQSWFVVGFDKVKKRNITVRPSQVFVLKP